MKLPVLSADEGAATCPPAGVGVATREEARDRARQSARPATPEFRIDAFPHRHQPPKDDERCHPI